MASVVSRTGNVFYVPAVDTGKSTVLCAALVSGGDATLTTPLSDYAIEQVTLYLQSVPGVVASQHDANALAELWQAALYFGMESLQGEVAIELADRLKPLTLATVQGLFAAQHTVQDKFFLLYPMFK